jgi:glycosyltransferase involved in cell wall biosynthesis
MVDIMQKIIMSMLLFVSVLAHAEIQEKAFVIIIPSYNNAQWLKNNLDSIVNQEYQNKRIIYINDCSSDGTGDLVEQYCKDHDIDYRVVNFNTHDDQNEKTIIHETQVFAQKINKESKPFILVNNHKRCGAMANWYRAIHSCADHEIVINVDGDDWLHDATVLQRINEVYALKKIWFTHGIFIEYPHRVEGPWSECIPEDIIKNGAFRTFKCPSHLRTYYAWLFKKIKLDDFLYDGCFLRTNCDTAMMLAIAEMAGERHVFMTEPTYVYNKSNPINDHRVNTCLQNDMDAYIRAKAGYKRLDDYEMPPCMKENSYDT